MSSNLLPPTIKEVNQSMLNEIIRLMSKQNLNSLTVDDLLIHLSSINIDTKIEMAKIDNERLEPMSPVALGDIFQQSCTVDDPTYMAPEIDPTKPFVFLNPPATAFSGGMAALKRRSKLLKKKPISVAPVVSEAISASLPSQPPLFAPPSLPNSSQSLHFAPAAAPALQTSSISSTAASLFGTPGSVKAVRSTTPLSAMSVDAEEQTQEQSESAKNFTTSSCGGSSGDNAGKENFLVNNSTDARENGRSGAESKLSDSAVNVPTAAADVHITKAPTIRIDLTSGSASVASRRHGRKGMKPPTTGGSTSNSSSHSSNNSSSSDPSSANVAWSSVFTSFSTQSTARTPTGDYRVGEKGSTSGKSGSSYFSQYRMDISDTPVAPPGPAESSNFSASTNSAAAAPSISFASVNSIPEQKLMSQRTAVAASVSARRKLLSLVADCVPPAQQVFPGPAPSSVPFPTPGNNGESVAGAESSKRGDSNSSSSKSFTENGNGAQSGSFYCRRRVTVKVAPFAAGSAKNHFARTSAGPSAARGIGVSPGTSPRSFYCGTVGGDGSSAIPVQLTRGDKAEEREKDNRNEKEERDSDWESESTGSEGAEQLGQRPAETRATDSAAKRLGDKHWQTGRDLYLSGAYEAAVTSFSRALLHCKEDTGPSSTSTQCSALGNRAAAHFMLGRYVEAVEDCEVALRLNPGLLKLQLRGARAHIKLGHFSEAQTLLGRLLSAAPGTADSAMQREARDCLVLIEQAQRTAAVMQHMEAAETAESALRCAEQLLENSPFSHSAVAAKARCLNKLQRYDAAMSYLTEYLLTTHSSVLALHAHPEAFLAPLSADSLALVLESRSNGQKHLIADTDALAEAVLCLGAYPGRSFVCSLKNSAHSHAACGDVIDSVLELLSTVQQRISRSGARGWTWVQAGITSVNVLLERKRLADKCFRDQLFGRAVNFYGEAIKADPEASRWQAVLHSNRAAAYMRMGQYQAAVGECNQALGADREYSRAYLRRARAYVSLKEFESAMKDFRRYLSQSPAPADRDDVAAELTRVLAESNGSRLQQQSSQSSKGSAGNTHGAGPSTTKDNPFTGTSWEYHGHHSWHEYKPKQRTHHQSTGASSGRGGGPSFEETFHSEYHKHGRSHDAPRTAAEKDACHYYVLGVRTSASDREIKLAYHRLARQYHPDKCKDAGAEDKFKQVTSAYTTLIDPTSRRQYDLSKPN